MAKITMAFGILLTLLGIGGYWGSNFVSWTALIPAFFGLPLLLLGWMALQDKWRKHAMHAATIVGLLGFLGATYSFYRSFSKFVAGEELERPMATIMQGLMAIICAVFVALCVKSFIDARRARAEKME